MQRAWLILVALLAGCAGPAVPLIPPDDTVRPDESLHETLTMVAVVCPSGSGSGCYRTEVDGTDSRFSVPGNGSRALNVTVVWRASSPSTEELTFSIAMERNGNFRDLELWTGRSPLFVQPVVPAGHDYEFNIRPAADLTPGVGQRVDVNITGPIYVPR